MKIGVCGYLRGTNADGVTFDFLQAARQAGFDYIELPLSTVAGLEEAEYQQLGEALSGAGIACEAFNLFFPGSLQLTGEKVNRNAIEAYLEKSLERVRELGAQVVVFGSGGARGVPAGFAMEHAWVQLVEMLRVAGDIANQNCLTIAIEPLNKAECNIIHTAAEGFALAKLVDHPNVRLLLDIYHMFKESEDFGIAVTAREFLAHAHFADPAQRTFPQQASQVGRDFFAALRRASYGGRVSIEAGYRDFQADGSRALAVMRELAG